MPFSAIYGPIHGTASSLNGENIQRKRERFTVKRKPHKEYQEDVTGERSYKNELATSKRDQSGNGDVRFCTEDNRDGNFLAAPRLNELTD